MIAIQTKYISPTTTRPARIKAWAGRNEVTITYDHSSKNPDLDAALELCKRLGWTGELIEGGIDGGNVYVFSSAERIEIPLVASPGVYFASLQ